MSEYGEEYDLGEEEQVVEDGPKSNADFAALRREKKAAAQAQAEALAAKRELEFYKAGIDPTDQRLSYFAKGYDGKIDANEIRKAAMEAGFLQSAPDPQAEVYDQSMQAAARIASTSAGAQATPTGDAVAQQSIIEAYKAGGMNGMLAALQANGITFNDR